VWPRLYTSDDFTGLLARHCTEPQLYDPTRSCSRLTPFFTLAVEMALLEAAGRFIATERSSPSRRVALKRHAKSRRLTHSAGSSSSSSSSSNSNSNSNSNNSSSSGSGSSSSRVHYLYSSQVLQLLSATTNVAEWERATLRGDEAAVLARDSAASDAAAQRYEACAAQFSEASRCMRAHGFALAPSMLPLPPAAASATASAATASMRLATGSSSSSSSGSGSSSELITTVLGCCHLCQGTHSKQAEPAAATEGLCTAFQWETNHTLHGLGRHSSSINSSPAHAHSHGSAETASAAVGQKEEAALILGRCTLRTGEVEIMPV
jgi:hypothetical protein